MVLAAPRFRSVGPTTVGLGITLASTAFFSWLGVTTQLAYDAGASVGAVLSGRFLVASAVLWLLVLVLRRRRPARDQVLLGLVLGAGYGVHAMLFSESLVRLDAGVVDMLLFTYPALVVLGAVALGRDRWSVRAALALGAASAGTTLVLVGGLSSVDPVGALLALASAGVYAAYILTSAGQLRQTDPLTLVALVSTGAAGLLVARGMLVGDVSIDGDASAALLVAAVGLVALAGMGTFVAGIGRLGPSRASIVSSLQPALTPVLGLAVFGDRLGAAQVVGGALVIAAIVVLEARQRASSLAWLPLRERLLLRAAAAGEVGAGTTLVAQGAPGDNFYLIERGRAVVTRGGRRVAELGPGDFFGELALLNRGVRTASVIADSDMRVRVVSGHAFERALQRLPTLELAVRSAALDRLAVPLSQPAVVR